LHDDLTASIEAAVREEPRLRHLQSVIVAADGDVLTERYFRGRTPEDLSNTHSITKSVLSALAGIAISDGALDLDTGAIDVLGSGRRPFVSDPRKARITVRHLLTMTSGLDPGGRHDIDEIADRGESWVEGPLAAPLVAEPGTTFAYNNGAAHVLSVLIAAKTGRPLLDFAEERLFAPLGIRRYRWPTDPEGNPLGYGHLELQPRDLVSLGQLYRERGRAGSAQVLDAEYVDAATTAATAGGPPEGTPYGFLWWVTQTAGRPSFFAGGFGGQYVSVVPSLRLVVVTTADVAVWIPSSADPRRLVEDVVVRALRG
jgi:CubicO group peptidase (beta-lactamase class C family)